jgi:hypothetical protein
MRNTASAFVNCNAVAEGRWTPRHAGRRRFVEEFDFPRSESPPYITSPRAYFRVRGSCESARSSKKLAPTVSVDKGEKIINRTIPREKWTVLAE